MRDASDHDEKVAAAAQSAGDQRTEQLTDNERTGQAGGEQAGQPGDKLTEQPAGEAAGQAGGEQTEQPVGEAAEQSGGEAAKQSVGGETELARLRAENVELRDKLTTPRRHRVRHGLRAAAAAVLITVGCVLAPISVLAIWTANQVSDTNRYVANMAPLIHEPAIQNALTDRLTTEITDRLDVQGLTKQAATALTDQGLTRVGNLLNSFAAPLSGAVDGFIHSQVARIVASPQVATLWTQLNETAHAQMVKVLSGEGGGAINVVNNQVTLQLGPFIKVIQHDLGQRFPIINNIPPVNPSFVLFEAKNLSKAQTAYRLINDLKYLLPVLTLLFLGLGVYLARRHRRALIAASLGVAASMFVLAIGLQIGRSIYLNSVPPSVLPPDAAAVLYDTVIRFIKDGLRLVFVLMLIVAIVAFFTGPAAAAVRTRRAFGAGMNKLRRGTAFTGLQTSPVGEWTAAHKNAVRIGTIILAAIIFVFWPSVVSAIVLAIILLLVLGFVELMSKPTGTEGVPQAGT
jgi:hypothetical protein